MFKPRRLSLIASSLLLAVLGACGDCDDLGNIEPQGEFEPALVDLGPVVLDTQCQPILKLVNKGGSELEITGGGLVDSSGEYENLKVPTFVSIASEEEVTLDYVAKSPLGRQSVTISLETNDPDSDGKISATITALATDEEAGVGKAYCPPPDDLEAFAACTLADFGAINIQDASIPIFERSGKTIPVKITNEGNAEMLVIAVVLDDGNPDFAIQGVVQGTLITPFPAEGILLPPGRQGSCGDATIGDENSVVLNLFYAPSALGADAETLVVLTDAVEGDNIEVPLSGFGSDIGIILTPDVIAFGAVAEDDTKSVDIVVSNVGTNNATINTTCIDVTGDDVCDHDCTGGDAALDGALNCEMFKSDGDTHEGKGFILDPTDALPGGTDERILRVTWSPVAGNAVVPANTKVRFETAILDSRVYEARVLGGATGRLTASPDAPAVICGEGVCLPATGSPQVAGEACDWTGSFTIALGNDGEASVVVNKMTLDDSFPTVLDDFTLEDENGNPLGENPGFTIGIGGESRFVVNYANSANDFSCVDIINLVIEHSGRNSPFTIPLQVADGN